LLFEKRIKNIENKNIEKGGKSGENEKKNSCHIGYAIANLGYCFIYF